MTTVRLVAPPATIGMLGGGQLGRYAIVAAKLAGYGTVVVDPDPDAPAGVVADTHLVTGYDDAVALDELAGRCAVVTTEFENPPAAALERLANDIAVAPSPGAVAIAQDRLAEKAFLAAAGVPVAPFAPLVVDSDTETAGVVGFPAVLKTSRLGYDGKGQRIVASADELQQAWDDFGRVPCIVERLVPLDVEVSVILARSADGATVSYPLAENVHERGILDLTVVPARVDPTLGAEAHRLAGEIAAALDYVGVLAVEMFVSSGHLLVNELAPRPHNSGHWTLDAATTSQFAQQIRAITGSGLGATAMTAPAVAMVNLLGDLWFAHDGDDAVEPCWAPVLGDAERPTPPLRQGHSPARTQDGSSHAAR